MPCSKCGHLWGHSCTVRGACPVCVSVCQTSDPSQRPDTLIKLLSMNCSAWLAAWRKSCNWNEEAIKRIFREHCCEKTEKMGTDFSGRAERNGKKKLGWRQNGDRCRRRRVKGEFFRSVVSMEQRSRGCFLKIWSLPKSPEMPLACPAWPWTHQSGGYLLDPVKLRALKLSGCLCYDLHIPPGDMSLLLWVGVFCSAVVVFWLADRCSFRLGV